MSGNITSQEVREVFYAISREKGSARPKPKGTSQKRPKRIVMPGDFVDKRRDESYRDSRVTLSVMSHWERMLYAMGLKELPSWNQFLAMSEEDQRKIMQQLCEEGLTDKQIAEHFSAQGGEEVQTKTVANKRYALGIRKFNPVAGTNAASADNGTSGPMGDDGVPSGTDQKKTAQTTTFKQEGLSISLVGEYTSSELSNKLLSLATLINDTNFVVQGQKFRLEIYIKEKVGDIAKVDSPAMPPTSPPG